MLLENGEDMLEEIELLIACARPEIIPIDDERLLRLFTRLVNDRDAALFSERRIGQHDFVLAMLTGQRVFRDDGQLSIRKRDVAVCAANAMEEQIHRAEPRDTIH